MKNNEVAETLYKIADLLDIKGDNFFKTRAYRIAAQKIETLDEDIQNVVQENRLKDIPGIGEALAKKITELVTTNKLTYYEHLKQQLPEGLLTLLEIPTLGPKKVAILYQQLNISTIQQLQQACEQGKLRNLDGFGEITERNILRGIQLKQKTSGRVLLNVATEDGQHYLHYLQKCPHIIRVSLAGSLRRQKETIGDLDILASSHHPDDVMTYFTHFPDVNRILLQGSTKTSVLLNDNLQVDLRVVNDQSYGAALQYFTGSKEHNVTMRSIAIKKKLKLNEYGLYKKDTDTQIAGPNEQDIYTKLGLSYIPPELRENRGEIQAAKKHTLPQLVTNKDIKGDLHVHSQYSDGTDTIQTIATHAQQIGYEYIGVVDHSQSLKIAQGLTEEKIRKKLTEIKKINTNHTDFRVLCGTECDIKADGTLDYTNQTLQLFDFVYIGIHTTFKLNQKQQTQRITQAMHNEHVNFLAHPTCRIIGRRQPLNLNLETIIDTAVETHTHLEINAFPDRLDLNDIHTKMAKEKNAHFVIGTDAHTINHLPFIQYGIATARRGWLEPHDIINTLPLKKIEQILNI